MASSKISAEPRLDNKNFSILSFLVNSEIKRSHQEESRAENIQEGISRILSWLKSSESQSMVASDIRKNLVQEGVAKDVSEAAKMIHATIERGETVRRMDVQTRKVILHLVSKDQKKSSKETSGNQAKKEIAAAKEKPKQEIVKAVAPEKKTAQTEKIEIQTKKAAEAKAEGAGETPTFVSWTNKLGRQQIGKVLAHVPAGVSLRSIIQTSVRPSDIPDIRDADRYMTRASGHYHAPACAICKPVTRAEFDDYQSKFNARMAKNSKRTKPRTGSVAQIDTAAIAHKNQKPSQEEAKLLVADTPLGQPRVGPEWQSIMNQEALKSIEAARHLSAVKGCDLPLEVVKALLNKAEGELLQCRRVILAIEGILLQNKIGTPLVDASKKPVG